MAGDATVAGRRGGLQWLPHQRVPREVLSGPALWVGPEGPSLSKQRTHGDGSIALGFAKREFRDSSHKRQMLVGSV